MFRQETDEIICYKKKKIRKTKFENINVYFIFPKQYLGKQ